MTSYSEQRFSARPGATAQAAQIILNHVPDNRPTRILDIGCGTGATLVEVLARRPLARGEGVDISRSNIEAAAALATARGCGTAVRWLAADYLKAEVGPADLIFSESVLHLIPATAAALLGKLARDLAPGGRMLLVMPDASPANAKRLALRRLLRAMRNPLLDGLIYAAARAVYRGWPAADLRERVEYMYVIPPNLDGEAWRREARRLGLRIMQQTPWPQTSIAKLRHNLVVYERG